MTVNETDPTAGPIAIRARGKDGEHVSLVGFRGVIVAVVKCAQGRKNANAQKLARGWNSLDRHTRHISDLQTALAKLVAAVGRPPTPDGHVAIVEAMENAKAVLAAGEWKRPQIVADTASPRAPRVLPDLRGGAKPIDPSPDSGG